VVLQRWSCAGVQLLALVLLRLPQLVGLLLLLPPAVG
jgi:hypothetical protein